MQSLAESKRVIYTDVYRDAREKRDYSRCWFLLFLEASTLTVGEKKGRPHSRCVYFVVRLSGVNDDDRHRLRARDSLVCSILITIVLEFHFHFLL